MIVVLVSGLVAGVFAWRKNHIAATGVLTGMVLFEVSRGEWESAAVWSVAALLNLAGVLGELHRAIETERADRYSD